ncbi:MAG: hypothetical protein K8R54_06125 [Bacteroidales bacterium]|nr:hypothetical protein [Bacteroidales bacterium]
MKSYIKLPKLKELPDSSIAKRKLSDSIWKDYIFFIILKYYKEVNDNDIIAIIQDENTKPRSEIEKKLKEHIADWYKRIKRTDKRTDSWGFILNLEPSSEYSYTGFDDLKFQHSDWTNKYFVFEAKNLGKTKSVYLPESIREYVYVKKKGKEDDGGMYRFMIGKYACDMGFGGMLGFIVGETKENVVKSLTEEIKFVYGKMEIGKLIEKKIIPDSIKNNENTFDSIHNRTNNKTGQNEKFTLHHVIMDFTRKR